MQYYTTSIQGGSRKRRNALGNDGTDKSNTVRNSNEEWSTATALTASTYAKTSPRSQATAKMTSAGPTTAANTIAPGRTITLA